MKVNFVDLVAQYHSIRDEIHAELDKVLSTGAFVLGPAVQEFEQAFAAYCGADHCVGVNSGTDALNLAVRVLGIGPGDEVITVANTFIATVNAIALAGATPVLVDINESDYLINALLIEQAITPRTKAIMPVHLYGQPADMDAVMAVARKHGLHVIEDACQAHGARYKGKAVGTFGVMGCFSFYPGKNLGSYGEGGAVVTNDPALAEQIRVYRNVGQAAKYVHPVVGFNTRLHSMQAAVLKVKLKYLNEWNAKRRAFAARYAERLAGTSLVLPKANPDVEHVWHLYVVQHDRRDDMLKTLQDQQIYCGIHYPVPVANQTAYTGIRTVPAGAPASARFAKRILSLPMHPDLTEEQIETVAKAVYAFERV
ncbi:MAG: DegT/DnrJ/EryC1/StrS family aminotransferase [Candidatus Hydrogenedentes bacterium]|nr:DegT/DnrJ/EryC1/StrS family aminotransferase [Candidatus Hydrogenedentota bacterium]